jgi:hypothetical protein
VLTSLPLLLSTTGRTLTMVPVLDRPSSGEVWAIGGGIGLAAQPARAAARSHGANRCAKPSDRFIYISPGEYHGFIILAQAEIARRRLKFLLLGLLL